ncbi:MAG: hypothetical protein M5U12_04640 [Verrucomicrobia bacterium]|nr:hypothetical protein [Verrucomicrobiota bacterium]
MNRRHLTHRRTPTGWIALGCGAVAFCAPLVIHAQVITLALLLAEMTNPAAVARWPQPLYQSLQASSYNRASTHRDQSDQTATGWFADSDGIGFIRTEVRDGQTEWVILEHDGPGCLTKFWTPFFYYDFQNRVGPNVRIYLDGADTPVIDESLIRLVRGEGTFRPPLAQSTARAGNAYVPIPFARGCKVTMAAKPFYFIINYRAYPEGTRVESFTPGGYAAAATDLERAGRVLTAPPEAVGTAARHSERVSPGGAIQVQLPVGPAALRQFTVSLPDAQARPALLRSTVLVLRLDGAETVWCPVGTSSAAPTRFIPFTRGSAR